MLFSLNPDTPQCRVFSVLNDELLYFLQASIGAVTFSDALFSRWNDANGSEIINVCWTNKPTREKFKALWEQLPTERSARQNIYDLVEGAQNISVYFDDINTPLPELANEELFQAFKSLTTHLFENTKTLKSAKEQAGSSIHQHFQDFKRVNSGSQLCYLCGTSHLSQDRVDVPDEKQWRADYDHILCKDKYPVYTVHPGNFIPTCHICNSKAKNAEDTLRDGLGHRRVAFYPLPPSREACYEYATVTPVFRDLADLMDGEWQDPLASAVVAFPVAPPSIQQKISVWDEIYQVPGRVEAEIKASFVESISSLLIEPQSFDEFSENLRRKAERIPSNLKSNTWSCWWYRVFQWLNNQNEQALEDIWVIFEYKLGLMNHHDLTNEFGV